jgi:large subunit ribosomal protein L24
VAFETRDEGLFARVRAGLAGAEAGALFAGAASPAVSGRLTMQAEVEGTGRSPAAFIGSLAGFANFSLERGQIAGLNPGVFDAVGRAVELGIPTTGDRISQFVAGVLDSAKVPVPSASANISIKAGLARFDDIAIPLAGAEMQAIAGINLADGTLNALLTLTGQTGASKVKPALAILLRGPVLAPRRTVDTTLLTSWLTLLTVEQQSRQIDAMEKAAREAAAPEAAKSAVVPQAPASAPAPPPQADTGVARSSESQAPPLPPAVEVPVRPRPRPPQQRSERIAPVPPDLAGAQH